MKFAVPMCSLCLVVCCVVGAVALMIRNTEGWGWLLFLAFIFGCIAENTHSRAIKASRPKKNKETTKQNQDE